MGLFKNLFNFSSKPSSEDEKNKKEVSFRTLCDDGVRSKNMGEFVYAICCFEQALMIKSDDNICMSYLAELYLRIERIPEAYELLRKLIVQEPDNKVLVLNTINAGMKLQKWKEVLDISESYMKKDKKEPLLFVYRGEIFFALEKNEDAFDSLSEAIALDENMFEAYYQRAKMNFHLKKYEEALTDIVFLLNHEEKSELVYILQGDILAGKGEIKAAYHAYDEARTLNPFSYEASEHYINLLIQEGLWKDALNECVELINSHKQSSQAYKLRAKIYSHLDLKKEALEDETKSEELLQLHKEEVGEEYSNIKNKMEAQYKRMNPYGF